MANLGPILTQLLTQYGLQGLIPWASSMATNGASPDEIEADLYNQKAFKDRFWMIFKRQKDGHNAISPSEVLAYETQAMEMASAFGVKVTNQEVGQWIADDKGLPEIQDRMTLASKATYQTDKTTRDELARRYGIGPGDLTNYWLRGDKALPELQRRYAQADIAGAAIRSGFHESLDEEDLGMLYDRGLTGENAGDPFGKLAETENLFDAVDMTEEDMSVKDQLKLITGDADLSKQVQQRADKRKAYFGEGGGFATGKSGVGGLGTANT